MGHYTKQDIMCSLSTLLVLSPYVSLYVNCQCIVTGVDNAQDGGLQSKFNKHHPVVKMGLKVVLGGMVCQCPDGNKAATMASEINL